MARPRVYGPWVSIDIRPARPADLASLAVLAARTFPLACPPDLERSAIDEFVRLNLSEAAFRHHLSVPGHSVLVGVTDDDRPVAYALLVDGTAMDETCSAMIVGRPTVGISKFYLDPDLHGSGAADLLLDAADRHARLRAASSVWLATNVENTRARAFYARRGFEERGHRVFLIAGVRNRDVVLERDLSAAHGLEPGQRQ